MATQEWKYHFDKLKIQLSFNHLGFFFLFLFIVSLIFFSFIGFFFFFFSITAKVTKFEEE